MKKRYLRLVRQAFRTLRHRKLRHRTWWQTISRPLFDRSLWMPCRDTVASGMAIGLFFSMMPMIPQSIVAAILAMRVKSNVPIAMAACFISNPFTNVPFWVAQIRLGQWLIDTLSLPVPLFLEKAHMSLPGVGTLSVSNFIVGFVAMGVLLAMCAYPIVHLFSLIMPHHLPVRSFRSRTMTKEQRNSARNTN
ncbi:MAG: DUF2062 domain-containing protein [Gloeobacteraceae cyanobacterium ES-bin-144]|nr:DUF2062 domain-containing protein [Verrucomicrobiales bacterium]